MTAKEVREEEGVVLQKALKIAYKNMILNQKTSRDFQGV